MIGKKDMIGRIVRNHRKELIPNNDNFLVGKKYWKTYKIGRNHTSEPNSLHTIKYLKYGINGGLK